MAETLIRAASELDVGECAGKPILVTAQGKPSITGAAPTVSATVSRRALRRLWASVSTLYLLVEPDERQVRITHIGASEYEHEALDGAVIGGDAP